MVATVVGAVEAGAGVEVSNPRPPFCPVAGNLAGPFVRDAAVGPPGVAVGNSGLFNTSERLLPWVLGVALATVVAFPRPKPGAELTTVAGATAAVVAETGGAAAAGAVETPN